MKSIALADTGKEYQRQDKRKSAKTKTGSFSSKASGSAQTVLTIIGGRISTGNAM